MKNIFLIGLLLLLSSCVVRGSKTDPKFSQSLEVASKISTDEECIEFKAIKFKNMNADVKDINGKTIPNYPIGRADVGDYTLDVGDTPKTILNNKTGKTCTTDVGLDGEVYEVVGSKKFLYESSAHGSSHGFILVNAETCKADWKVDKILGSWVQPNSVTINAMCGECEKLPGKLSGTCECESAKVWNLTKNCEMILDQAASKKATLKQLKVEFFGKKNVFDAKSDKARIVK